jgi:hypothetical protein
MGILIGLDHYNYLILFLIRLISILMRFLFWVCEQTFFLMWKYCGFTLLSKIN